MNALKDSETDSLTQLFNRNRFNKEIEKIYNNQLESYCLALIDLDNLRELNNKYGHMKGDMYLSKVGEILKKYEKVNFFRIGGDEFAGIINFEKNNIDELFKNIIEEMNYLQWHPKLSISVGVARINLKKTYLENYENVDNLLYIAKSKGKNRYIIDLQ